MSRLDRVLTWLFGPAVPLDATQPPAEPISPARCRFGRHRWQPVAAARTPVRWTKVLEQCQRCPAERIRVL